MAGEGIRTPVSDRLRGALLPLLLLGIMGLLGVLEPRFLTVSNLLNLLRQSSIVGIVAFGMTCVILSGGIDLSVGSVLALSAIVAGTAVKSGLPFWVAWGAALLVGAACGGITGFTVGKLRVPPFIASLGMMGAARGLSLLYTEGASVTCFPQPFRFLGAGWFAGLPVPLLLLAAAFVIAWFLLEKTTWGEQVRCIGSNRTAAFGTGIDVPRVTGSTYVLIGIASAMAGLMLAGRLDSAQPTAGLGYEFGAIAAVVLGGTQFAGGKGKLTGTVLGVLIIGTLENGINILNVNPFYEQVVKGLVIALALVFYGRFGNHQEK